MTGFTITIDPLTIVAGVPVAITSEFFGMTINGPVESSLAWPSWSPSTFRILDQFDSALPSSFLPGWTFIETSNGTYSWSMFDAVAAKYVAEGVVDVIWGFEGVPQWATIGNGYSFSCTITAANPGVVTATGNNFFNGALVYFSGGTLPTGLTAGTDYYVINRSGNTFNLSTTFNGSAIHTTGSSGSSTVTMEETPPSSASMLTNFINSYLTRAQADGFPINYVEGPNEPNNVPGGWQGTIADAVTLQSTIYSAVQAWNASNNASIKVLSPPASDAGSFTNSTFWMYEFLLAGGGAYFDILSYHAYPNFTGGGGPNDPEQIVNDIASIKAAMAAAGISKPIWISEYDSGNGSTAAQNATFGAITSLLAWSLGVQRQYWYAYDNGSGFGQLWTSGGGLNAAGIAWQQMTKWMIGASMTQGAALVGVVYTMSFSRPGGYQAQAVWTTDGSTPSYTVPAFAKQYHDVAGNLTTGIGATVTIGRNPILLENFSVF